jgi:DNA-binding FadR family transcriptional regulator
MTNPTATILPIDESAAAGERLESGVYRELLSRIQTGVYPMGNKLPAEMELASEFGVSRPVVRTALARLREDGLIISRRGAGSFVDNGKYQEISGFTPLRSIDDIATYWSFRKLVEAEAAATAALQRSEADIDLLNAVQSDLAKAIDSGASTVDLNTKLHIVIAETSNNHFYVDTIKLLIPHMDFVGKLLRSLSSETYQLGKHAMHQEHQAIVDAIIAGDAEAARKAAIAHIETSERRVFKGG